MVIDVLFGLEEIIKYELDDSVGVGCGVSKVQVKPTVSLFLPTVDPDLELSAPVALCLPARLHAF